MIPALLVQLLLAPVGATGAEGFSGRQLEDYRVGAGDVLEIQVYGEPSLSGSFPVDDNGELSFPLIGAVRVRGLTTTEVTARLVRRLSPDYIINANVTVWVSEYGSQPVQVVGAVAEPGVYHLDGPTTLLELLNHAGGVLEGATEIRITDSQKQVTVIAYEALLRDAAEEFELEAGAIVVVTESRVAVMGEVGKPGEIAFREGLTVSQSIAAAGGLLPTGSTRRIFVLRGEEQIRVDLAKVLEGEEPDLVLEPGDAIFVKRALF